MWLTQQLIQTYGVSKKLAEPLARLWIQKTQILLLLDGLDELGHENQVACIEALEDFLAQHPALSAIICCRREEYEQVGRKLKQLKGAIYLQAAGSEQIQQYLEDLGCKQLWNNIQRNPELLALARSPLFLTMLVVAYQEQPILDRKTLFDAYIQTQLHVEKNQGTYSPRKGKTSEQTLLYLRWLASQLKKKNETEFLIENLQPDWLPSKRQELIYKLSVGPIFGLSVGLIFGLSFGLIYGLSAGLSVGLSFGLTEIEQGERLEWDPRRGLSFGLSFGLIGGLIYGLSGGPSFGLIGRLTVGPTVEAIEQKQVSNQGIKKSVTNGMIYGLIGGLIGGLSGGLVYG